MLEIPLKKSLETVNYFIEDLSLMNDMSSMDD